MDDGVVLAKTKAELWKIRDAIHYYTERPALVIKENERVFPVGEGIDYLGYVTLRCGLCPSSQAYQAEVRPKNARGKVEKKGDVN